MLESGIKYLIIFNILFFTSFFGYSQDSKELETIIEILENYSNDEAYSLNELNLLSLNIEKRTGYITDLKTELKNINSQISNLSNTVKKLEIELNTSKTIYKKLIYFAYIYKYKYNNFTFIVTAGDINKIFYRIKFLKLLTQYRKRIIEAIEFVKTELLSQKEILEEYSDIKSNIVEKLNNQNTILESDLNQKILAITNLQQKNNNLRKELLNKEELYSEILNYLNTNSKNVDSELSEKTLNFETAKGQLKLPIKNGIVIKQFGEYKHPVLEQVTIRNDGIDIAPSDEYNVRAVFDGVVTNIISIPGENHAILIKHGDYFSVYTNIIDLEVVANQYINENQIIGKVPEIENEVTVINFQIWYLTEKQNPLDWINL
jgi:septal ring factor EnvC (AmiA/AmiB activator)